MRLDVLWVIVDVSAAFSMMMHERGKRPANELPFKGEDGGCLAVGYRRDLRLYLFPISVILRLCDISDIGNICLKQKRIHEGSSPWIHA